MAGVEVMSVTWDSHHKSVISVFDSLLKTETLVDCTLAAEGKFIKVHKIIISACSPYLKSLLVGASDSHPILILNDTRYSDLESLVEYMYKGGVMLPKERVKEFKLAAEHLQIRGLFDPKQTQLLKEGDRRERRRNRGLKRTRPATDSYERYDDEAVNLKTELFSEEETTVASDDDPDWEPEPSTSSRVEEEANFENSDEKTVGILEEEEKITVIVIPEDEEEVVMKRECPKCSMEFLDGQSLRRHLRQHSRNRKEFPFKCDACGTFFKLQRTLDAHSRWVCGKEPLFVCDKCGKRFHREKYLRQHERVHWAGAPGEPSFCLDCGRLFKHKMSLENHLRYECGKEPELACEVCGLKFHFKARLNDHKLTFHSEALLVSAGPEEPGPALEEEYRCELCPRSFSRIGSLNYHVSRKHSGKALETERDPIVYAYACSTCGNRYRNSTQLCRHRKWECGKDPLFACTQCSKRFHHRHGLKQHLRLHLAKREPESLQFYCEKCGKGYKLRSSLNNHTKWECGKEPLFACTVCFVKFSHKGNLKKHILTKHIRSYDENQMESSP